MSSGTIAAFLPWKPCIFPGDENGTISEKIAYVISNELQTKADFYLDIHGGDVHEELLPHIYYPGLAEENVVKSSIEMAKCFNVPYIVHIHHVLLISLELIFL